MGLRLDPNEVKAMIASAKAAIVDYNNELRGGLPTINGIVNEQALDGEAYSAFKCHMVDHALVVSGLISAGEEYISLLSSISDAVGSEVLDEDSLREGIATCISTIKTFERHIVTYRRLLCDPIYSTNFADYAYRRISQCEGVIELNEGLKRELEEKIKALFEIDVKLTGIVSGMESPYVNAVAGIGSLEGSWNGSYYTMPSAAKWRDNLIEEVVSGIKKMMQSVSQHRWNDPKTSLLSSTASALALFAKNALITAGNKGATSTLVNQLTKLVRYTNPLPVYAGASVINTTVDIVDWSVVLSKMGKAAKAAPFIGCAIDAGIQIASGEDVGDAMVKAGAHVAIETGITVAATAIIGATPVGWAAVGVFALGVGVSMAFDFAYDNYADDIKDTVKKTATKIGKRASKVIDEIGSAVNSSFYGFCASFL